MYKAGGVGGIAASSTSKVKEVDKGLRQTVVIFRDVEDSTTSLETYGKSGIGYRLILKSCTVDWGYCAAVVVMLP